MQAIYLYNLANMSYETISNYPLFNSINTEILINLPQAVTVTREIFYHMFFIIQRIFSEAPPSSVTRKIQIKKFFLKFNRNCESG